MTKKFLTGAYDLQSQEQTKQMYVEWAASYDQELAEAGYHSPKRTADALVAVGADLRAPVLDIGCGSGISGERLREVGFERLVGSDFSPEMLAQAEKKQIYDVLHLADFNAPFGFIDEPFTTMTAVGVFSVGHAEPEVLQTVVDLMPNEGLFAFSLNDHTLEDPGYLQRIQELVLQSKIRIRWQEYGEHVPGIDLQSMIMVIEKLAN